MRLDKLKPEEIKERNQWLYEHMTALAKPEPWRRSLEMTESSLAAFAADKWLEGVEYVYVVGHGTSYATAMNAERWFARIAGVFAQAVPAFQFKSYPADYLHNPKRSMVVGISSGGNTFSVAESMRLARESGAKTVCLCGRGDGLAIPAQAEFRVEADTDSEKSGKFPSPAYSVSHIYLLLAAFRLAVLLGSRRGRLSAEDELGWRKKLDAAIDAMSALPGLYQRVADVADALADNGMVNMAVLGAGPNLGTMQEGALKISEFCWRFGAAEELEDFAHGRFREVGTDEALLILAPGGPALAKAMDILAGCAIAGTPSVVFTDAPNPAMEKLASHIVRMPPLEDEYMTPMSKKFLSLALAAAWRCLRSPPAEATVKPPLPMPRQPKPLGRATPQSAQTRALNWCSGSIRTGQAAARASCSSAGLRSTSTPTRAWARLR